MNNEEAIRYIKNDIHGVYADEKYFKAHHMAIDALEKQIAIKPILEPINEYLNRAICPSCGEIIFKSYGDKPAKGCPVCLQTIDWSDEK